MRNSSDRLLYSQEDLERLKLMAALTQMGSAISQIASFSSAELKDILFRLNQTQALPTQLSAQKMDTFNIPANLRALLKAVKNDDLKTIF
jgi:DNA-binding transcriptional MerR regulator